MSRPRSTPTPASTVETIPTSTTTETTPATEATPAPTAHESAISEVSLRDLLPTNVAELVPPQTEQDILNFGRSNLQYFYDFWSGHASGLVSRLSVLSNRINLLDHKTPADLRELARTYPYHDVSDPKAIRQGPSGGTTFTTCNTCQYNGCNGVDSTHIRCQLWYQREPYDTETSPQPNAPCLLANGDPRFLAASLAVLRAQYADFDGQRAHHLARMQRLQELIARADDRPLIPKFRPYAHFDAGETIVCFFDAWDTILPSNQLTFCLGTLHDYPQYHHVELDSPVSTNKADPHWLINLPMDSGPWSMSKSDCRYFYQNPDYFQLWLKLSTIGTPAIAVVMAREFRPFYEAHRAEIES